jgi:hypothetical protein
MFGRGYRHGLLATLRRGCDVALQCQPWWHCSLDGGPLAILCNVVSVVAFVIVF